MPLYRILFLLMMAMASSWSLACESFLKNDEDPIKLGIEAVTLFKRTERIFETEGRFRGFHKRLMDLELAEKLKTLALRLKTFDPSQEPFLNLLHQQVEILSGERPLYTYARREQIGFESAKKKRKQDSDLSNFERWEALESSDSHYQKLGDGIYLSPRGPFDLPLDFDDLDPQAHWEKNRKRILGLYQTRLSDETHVTHRQEGEKLIREDISLYILPDGRSIYRLRLRRWTLKPTGEVRDLIYSITRLSFSQERNLHSKLAELKGILDSEVTLRDSYEDRNRVFIPKWVGAKIQIKHQLSLRELKKALRNLRLHHFGLDLSDPTETYYKATLYMKGRPIKLIFQMDSSSKDRMILKTAYSVD